MLWWTLYKDQYLSNIMHFLPLWPQKNHSEWEETVKFKTITTDIKKYIVPTQFDNHD
jgi:hypothetical protein